MEISADFCSLIFLGVCTTVFVYDSIRSLNRGECEYCGDCGFDTLKNILGIGILLIGMRIVWVSYKNEVMKKIDILGDRMEASAAKIEESTTKIQESINKQGESTKNMEASITRMEASINALTASIRAQTESTASSLENISGLFQSGQERIIAARREIYTNESMSARD